MTTDDQAESVWGGDQPGASARDIGTSGAADYTPALGRQGWLAAITALGDLAENSRALDKALAHGVQYQLDNLHGDVVLGLVAQVQSLRRVLAQTEAILARQVGMDEVTSKVGVLPDGRKYEVRKGANRKQWDHQGWQHDVRAEVAVEASEQYRDGLVNAGTGEAVDVVALLIPFLTQVQQVHGAGAPKVTALKALALSVDDYCETVSGSWGVQVAGDVEV